MIFHHMSGINFDASLTNNYTKIRNTVGNTFLLKKTNINTKSSELLYKIAENTIQIQVNDVVKLIHTVHIALVMLYLFD